MLIPIKLPKEEKEAIVRQVQVYFQEERSESIGELAAEQLIDFMMKQLGSYFYNKAISDMRSVVQEKFAQIDDELYALEIPKYRE
ncbi:DUF2164 domain-containing protein [Cohnella caldifontis]|uniref:DUF2164 domain-containing protein n=1 Tax=Cohnella caldifontis TaxID=3027471 RepID=UPI0023EB960D|nr:DUF2164 domain-containing protein [Cohnella sp. YIM B05605]